MESLAKRSEGEENVGGSIDRLAVGYVSLPDEQVEQVSCRDRNMPVAIPGTCRQQFLCCTLQHNIPGFFFLFIIIYPLNVMVLP